MPSDTIAFVDAAPRVVGPLHAVAVRLHKDDDVAIAKAHLPGGTVVNVDGNTRLTIRQLVPSGHKLALRSIVVGESIRRYG